MSRSRRLAVIVIMAAIAPGQASAHLVTTGLGPAIDGVSHYGLNPADYLPVAALGLFCGLKGPASARASLAAVAGGWLLGGAAALLGAAPPVAALSIATALLLIGIGGSLAANLNLSPAAGAALGVLLGGVRGLADLQGASNRGAAAAALLAMGASAFTTFALAASLTLPLKRNWQVIAARVGGSWVAATGLLLAGWVLKFGSRIG